jgi:molybdopterin biosynthesis enzyme MoaB
VTPEATRAVLDKEAPGLAERIRRLGEEHNPHSILSRGVCGSHLRTLVVNLPESADGAAESFEAVADVLPHAVLMLRGSSHPARHERA